MKHSTMVVTQPLVEPGRVTMSSGTEYMYKCPSCTYTMRSIFNLPEHGGPDGKTNCRPKCPTCGVHTVMNAVPQLL
eukprot:g17228.t1